MRAWPQLEPLIPDLDITILRENTEGFYPDRNLAWGYGEFARPPACSIAASEVRSPAAPPPRISAALPRPTHLPPQWSPPLKLRRVTSTRPGLPAVARVVNLLITAARRSQGGRGARGRPTCWPAGRAPERNQRSRAPQSSRRPRRTPNGSGRMPDSIKL